MVLIALPVYMLFIRDDGSGGSSDSTLVQAVNDPAKAAEALPQDIGDDAQGIEIHYPADWQGQLDKGTVRVSSPDKGTAIAVVAGGSSGQAKGLFAAATNGVAADFQSPKITYAKEPGAIAGLPSAQAVIKGTQNGQARSVLIAVVRGAKRSYVVSVFTPSEGGDVGTANLIVARGLSLDD